MKKSIIILSLILLIGCTNSSKAYPPKTPITEQQTNTLKNKKGNIKTVYNNILKKTKRGKYETTDEYKDRTKNITNANNVAIVELDGKGKYYPDAQKYGIEFPIESPHISWAHYYSQGVLGQQVLSPYRWRDSLALNTKTSYKATNTYESNAYGASAVVENSTEYGYSVFPDNLKNIIQTNKNIEQTNTRVMTIFFPATREMAKKYDKHKFKLKAEVLLTDLENSMLRATSYTDADISFLYRVLRYYDAVNGHIQKLIVLNSSTKEVLFVY